MITFDSLTLKAFLYENKDFLQNARIQKIRQPSRREFIFVLRNNGETRKLYINIDPHFHHVCFMSEANEIKRHIETPLKPPMFCMLLRKYLENAKICKVNQPEYERILEFYVETYNELSEKIYMCLAIELMGKHSNVVLYNYDTNVITGCAHNVGSEKSREREMAGTLPYVYPPKQYKNDILSYKGEINYDTLDKDFYWFSKSFASHCIGLSIEKLRSFVNLVNLAPGISQDYSEFFLFDVLNDNFVKQNNVNEMIDNYFAYHQEKNKFQNLKSGLTSIVSRRLKKIENTLDKMNKGLMSVNEADCFRLYGDIIMANLYSQKDYKSEIDVYDYENNKNITIKLDETKTLKDNANIYYKKYNKAKTAAQKRDELSIHLIQEKAYYEQLIYYLNSALTIDDLLGMKEEINTSSDVKSDKKPSAITPELVKRDNAFIYIGKNNKQNEYIISKLAKDDDIWFHVQNCAGSHVLLKSTDITDEMILECAKLAKQYSSASNSAKAGVIYTKAKYLRKPPGAKPGYVTYKYEKEIII